MKKEYFNYLRGGAWLLFALLVGLPNMMAAAGQTDELVITKDVRYEDEVNVKKLIIRDNSEEPTDRIDIYLENNSTVETITVESGNAEIFFSGAEGVEYNLGSITVAQGAELTLSLGFPRQMNIGSVTNNGRFIDLTGSVQKVGGTHSFEIQQAEGYSKMGTLGIHSEIKKETLDPEMEVSLQKKEGENWKDDEAIKDALAEHIAFSVSESGTYRLKWVYKDDKNNGYAELYSKEINLLQITGNETLKDVHYNAIALNNGNITEATKVSMDNVHADPCTTEENAAGFSVGLYSNLELTLTGTNSELGILRNHGTMVLKQEGDAQLENTTIYNEGTFTDETGNKGMILGPAGLWIQEIKPNADITAPDGTQLKSISFQYAIKSFYKKIIVETYRNGQWMNYDEIKGGESENENPELRSTQGDETEKWTLRASYVFTTAIKGTYRFKIETTNDKNTPTCKTIWYSQPYELIASEFEINNDQLALGEANNTTVIPSLLITAGKDGSEKDATLENIEISEHAVETPSVNVEEGAKVNLTLKGTNDLGSIQLAKGSTMTLKPETTGDENMSDKLFISSVRNGGSFTDETATVSSVKDLENHTMIEFTDTIIYQVGDAISVTLRAVGNSSTGDYLPLGDPKREKLVNGKWVDALSQLQWRAGETAENPNQSAEAVLNLTTTKTGIYRMKVTSTDIEYEAHNATLYFMFEIVDLGDKLTIKTIDGTTASIEGTSEEYKDANMLIFVKDKGTASPVEVTLNNVQLKEAEGYEEYTSSLFTEGSYEITLNGENKLGELNIFENASVTLQKGDQFDKLTAMVRNAGKFTDETGTIQNVVDSKGLTMVDITGYELPAWNGYILKVNFDFFFGNYEVIPEDEALEHLVDGEWVAYHNSVMRSAEGTSEWSAPQSGEIAYTYTGLEEGKYRVKVYAEEWITGIEEGSKENPHAVTLYHYFTISEPAPEPTYYGITLPSVEGATTSPAAGTYWEYEGSSFSFSLTLDPAYDQSKPEVKANGQVVTPSENGTYTIANISEDVTITIEGIAENTPTGNAEVDDDSVKVWGADGILHLYTPVKAKVWVYTLNGVLVRAVDEVIGNQTISLAGGSYIIVIDDQKYKLRF